MRPAELINPRLLKFMLRELLSAPMTWLQLLIVQWAIGWQMIHGLRLEPRFSWSAYMFFGSGTVMAYCVITAAGYILLKSRQHRVFELVFASPLPAGTLFVTDATALLLFGLAGGAVNLAILKIFAGAVFGPGQLLALACSCLGITALSMLFTLISANGAASYKTSNSLAIFGMMPVMGFAIFTGFSYVPDPPELLATGAAFICASWLLLRKLARGMDKEKALS